jgi:hypothetical protein
MATPIGLSLLSQISRMKPPTKVIEMVEPFIGVLNDLKDKEEWYY